MMLIDLKPCKKDIFNSFFWSLRWISININITSFNDKKCFCTTLQSLIRLSEIEQHNNEKNNDNDNDWFVLLPTPFTSKHGFTTSEGICYHIIIKSQNLLQSRVVRLNILEFKWVKYIITIRTYCTNFGENLLPTK